jgi:hypothetical protein
VEDTDLVCADDVFVAQAGVAPLVASEMHACKDACLLAHKGACTIWTLDDVSVILFTPATIAPKVRERNIFHCDMIHKKHLYIPEG